MLLFKILKTYSVRKQSRSGLRQLHLLGKWYFVLQVSVPAPQFHLCPVLDRCSRWLWWNVDWEWRAKLLLQFFEGFLPYHDLFLSNKFSVCALPAFRRWDTSLSVFSSVGVLRMSLGKLPRAALCVIFGTKYRHRILVCVENGVKERMSRSVKCVCLTLPLVLKFFLNPMRFLFCFVGFFVFVQSHLLSSL